MADDGGGHITDTLVILIFVYLAGMVTGILGFAYWRRPTADKEEEEEAEVPAPPPPQPEPALLIEKIRVVVPPPAVRVGITHSCYAYHDVDNPDARCEEMIAYAAQTAGKPEENRRRDSIRASGASPRAAIPTSGQNITLHQMDSLLALGLGNV